MRVLVLHPTASSASTLYTTLSKLEERLWTQHGIELVFVDAPLLDVTVGRSLGCDDNGDDDGEGGGVGEGGDGESVGKGDNCGDRSGGENGLNEIEEGEMMSRRWYVEEECIDERRSLVDDKNADNNNNDSSNNNNNNNNNNSAPQNTIKKRVQYSGLDASLLHITQIWSRGGASSGSGLNNEGMQQLPFQGILGFGQGANIAAMLPLLNHAGDAYNNNNKDDGEEGIDMESGKKCIFEGLQFVILVDGRDIMNQVDDNDSSSDSNASNNNNDDEEEEEEDSWYVGPNGVSSLHLIPETTTAAANNSTTKNDSKRQSELLAKRYGPNATIQYYKPNTKKTNNSPTSSSTTQQYNTPSLHNLLGHHLVLQKKTLLSNPNSRKLLSLQTQLYTVEQLATIAITNEIKMNPPKCLMAMIGPSIGGGSGSSSGGKENCQNDDNDNDDKQKKQQDEEKMNSSEQEEVQIVGKTVGAWQGPGRVFGEQGGGAPCPESFLLRQEDRVADGGDGGSSDGGDNNKKSSVTVTASLL